MSITRPDYASEPLAAPDPGEFERFWHHYYRPLTKYVIKHFGTADADDIVQETMVRSLEHWSDLDPERDAIGWLVTVARRIGYDQARTRDRRERIEQDNAVPVTAVAGPDELVCAAERAAVVQTALARLPQPDRTVVSLHYFDEVPTAQIAELQGRSDGSVRQHLFRARRKAAEEIQNALRYPQAAFAPVADWVRRWSRRGSALLSTSGIPTAACCLSVAATLGIAGLLPAQAATRGNGATVESLSVSASSVVDDKFDVHDLLRGGHPSAVPGDQSRNPTARHAATLAPPHEEPPVSLPPVPGVPGGGSVQGGPGTPDQPFKIKVWMDVLPGHDPWSTEIKDYHFPGEQGLCSVPTDYVTCSGKPDDPWHV